MRTLLIILLALFLMSCRTQIATNYKVITKKRSYYTNELVYVNDSISFSENCRNGTQKMQYKIPFLGTKIINAK